MHINFHAPCQVASEGPTKPHIQLERIGFPELVEQGLVEAVLPGVGCRPAEAGAAVGLYEIFIRPMLMDGPFLTLLSRGVVHHEPESGSLTAIPIDHPLARVEEGLAYRAGNVHPPALFALI